MKTIVHVDGYNLYYGLLRGSPWKWLDLFALFQNHVLTDAEVLEVRYYTAPVLARMCDDPASPQRQRLYLQALRKHPPSRVVIVEGRMVATTPVLRLVAPVATQNARHLSRDLTSLVDWSKVLSPVHLAAAQLPDRIHGTAIRRPVGW